MKKIILTFLSIILLAGIGAFGFYAYTYADDGGLITTPGTSDSGQIISQLRQLEAIQLSKTIFTSQAFTSLIDYGIPVVPEPVSRPNPFAPIGQD